MDTTDDDDDAAKHYIAAFRLTLEAARGVPGADGACTALLKFVDTCEQMAANQKGLQKLMSRLQSLSDMLFGTINAKGERSVGLCRKAQDMVDDAKKQGGESDQVGGWYVRGWCDVICGVVWCGVVWCGVV
jgi:hypothetical protein